MTLITEAQYTELLDNGYAALAADRVGLDIDLWPVVKLFTRDGYARWLLTEIDPANADRAFGLCDFGDGRPVLGSVSLHDIEDMRYKPGLRVERDLHFVADKPLSAYAQVAYTRGLIIT
jgi:hypothetical protein